MYNSIIPRVKWTEIYFVKKPSLSPLQQKRGMPQKLAGLRLTLFFRSIALTLHSFSFVVYSFSIFQHSLFYSVNSTPAKIFRISLCFLASLRCFVISTNKYGFLNDELLGHRAIIIAPRSPLSIFLWISNIRVTRESNYIALRSSRSRAMHQTIRSLYIFNALLLANCRLRQDTPARYTGRSIDVSLSRNDNDDDDNLGNTHVYLE